MNRRAFLTLGALAPMVPRDLVTPSRPRLSANTRIVTDAELFALVKAELDRAMLAARRRYAELLTQMQPRILDIGAWEDEIVAGTARKVLHATLRFEGAS